jgi:hypothetical protein
MALVRKGAIMALNIKWDTIEPSRSALRLQAARVDRELSRLGDEEQIGPQKLAGLIEAWAGLLDSLALGPEPALRECPFCQRSIVKAAVRCRYCMKRSAATAVDH